jgi:hypothetical protein
MTQSVEHDRGVRQGCRLSATLHEQNTFRMEHRQYTRDTTNKKQRNKNIFSADDQVITAESEPLLQKSICKLKSIISKCGLTTSTSRTKK